MSSDSDEDYMSDKFLSKCVKEDTRPGLIRNRVKQREMQVIAKKVKIDEEQKNKINPRKRLEEGLKNTIGSENKGFALLVKMGYKKGESLGKESKGITEPINITIKSDRRGLGVETKIKEDQEVRRKQFLEKTKVTEISAEEYRKRVIKKAEERSIEIDLRKCQRICQKLDQENEVEKPEFVWFWNEQESSTLDDEEFKTEENEEEVTQTENDDEVEYLPLEKLTMLLEYLRRNYNYCYWCGTRFSDNEDLVQNCPGLNKDDH